MGKSPYELVVVGASLGGFDALKRILAGLPAEFALPLAIVQHRGVDRGANLPALLQRYSALPVADAEDKEPILPGRAYLAPAGYHLLVEPGSFALSTEAPVLYARPSIDLLFESAADTYGAGAIGVALTGSTTDGVAGLVRIKRGGGLTIAQAPATAEAPVLPAAAVAAGAVDRVLPLDEIAPFVASLGRQAATR